MTKLPPWQVIDNAIAEYERIKWIDQRKKASINKVDIKEKRK